MAKAVQFRRGTSAECDKFTGLEGEVIVDTTNKEIRVHDGSTLGGFAAAQKADIVSVNDAQALTSAQVALALKNLHLDPSSAGFANSIYRGHNILNYFTEEEISAKLKAGDFSGLFIGDYIEKTITVNNTNYARKWRFAHFDYQINCGDTNCSSHHVVLCPETVCGSAAINASNTTSGGYAGSTMWTTTIPLYAEAIKAAFGTDHVLSYRTLLASSVSTSAASGAGAGWVGSSNSWGWYDCVCNIPNEVQVYGSRIFSSSAYDVGERKEQLALFRLNPASRNLRATYWLSAVASGTNFCICYNIGDANTAAAGLSLGVLPLFLYH